MKDIHPSFSPTKITCACGNVVETYSTLAKDYNTEICSACHPFYTGKQKLMDTEGRVDRFNKKWAKREEILKKQKQKGPRTVTIR